LRVVTEQWYSTFLVRIPSNVIYLQLQLDIQSATYRAFQKELYSDIPNVTVSRVLRKRLHLKAHKLSTIHQLEQWIVCTPLSVNMFVTQHWFEYFI
jgi:hypothetical protein